MSMTSPVLIKKYIKRDKKGCCNWKKQLRQQKVVVVLIYSLKYVDYLCSSSGCTAWFMLPFVSISKSLLGNWAALSFQNLKYTICRFYKNYVVLSLCSKREKQNKTDFLLLTPAIFSVKVIVSGQWTERALFSDSILFYAALINITYDNKDFVFGTCF